MVVASPWNSIVHFKNTTQTSVTVLLVRSCDQPTHEGATQYEVPANDTQTISSGYWNEPRATLLIRTGLDEAKVFRVPHAGRLLVSLAPHGLKVETTDRVEVSDYPEPREVTGHDTFPMLLRGESFSSSPQRSHSGDGLESQHSGVMLGRAQSESIEVKTHQDTQHSGVLLGHTQSTTSQEKCEINATTSGELGSSTDGDVLQRHRSRLSAPEGLEQ